MFDLSFLSRFFPSLKYAFSIDTFQLSQAMVPYSPSYALEIISQSLEEKPLFLSRKSKFFLKTPSSQSIQTENPSLISSNSSQQESFHDAFFDTKATLVLFCYLIEFL